MRIFNKPMPLLLGIALTWGGHAALCELICSHSISLAKADGA